MASPITWIAGPVRYWAGNYDSFDLAWEFVGGNANYEIRRWRLRYQAKERRFMVTPLTSDMGDQQQATTIRNLYQHVAVARRDLPKGDITVALRAMLPEAEIAAALRASIKKGQ